MNRARKAFEILRHLGPRVVWLRARGYFDKATGATRRHNPLRTWESVTLAEMVGDQAPHDPAAFAAHKRAHLPAFLFP
ncbi:MAG: hypothetical protein HZB38_16775, partial [Planctomycetes bacterium]|nr:hypothetical protein [Planctomycetota bacterium]